MKKLTITLDESVAHWAEMWAAENNIDLSQLVGDLLRERMQEEQGYAAAMGRYLGRKQVHMKESGGYPARDELHDRDLDSPA